MTVECSLNLPLSTSLLGYYGDESSPGARDDITASVNGPKIHLFKRNQKSSSNRILKVMSDLPNHTFYTLIKNIWCLASASMNEKQSKNYLKTHTEKRNGVFTHRRFT